MHRVRFLLGSITSLAGTRATARPVGAIVAATRLQGPWPRRGIRRPRGEGGRHHAQQLRQELFELGVIGHAVDHSNSCTAQLLRWYSRGVKVAPHESQAVRSAE